MGCKLPVLFMAAVLGGSVSRRRRRRRRCELRFDIADYKVEGNSLLKPAEIARALAPFRGKNRDFGDVQRAVEALEAAYRKAGYAAVRVYLPEQELNEGVVVLRVVEAKIGAVTVTGNKYFDAANIRRSVPAVREGTTPSAPRIADNTRLANENPAKQTRVVLQACRPAQRGRCRHRGRGREAVAGLPHAGQHRHARHRRLPARRRVPEQQPVQQRSHDHCAIRHFPHRAESGIHLQRGLPHPHLLARRQHRLDRRLFRRGRRHHADTGRPARVHRTGLGVPGSLQLAAAAPRRVRASRHLRPGLPPVRQFL